MEIRKRESARMPDNADKLGPFIRRSVIKLCPSHSIYLVDDNEYKYSFGTSTTVGQRRQG